MTVGPRPRRISMQGYGGQFFAAVVQAHAPEYRLHGVALKVGRGVIPLVDYCATRGRVLWRQAASRLERAVEAGLVLDIVFAKDVK